MRAPGEHVVTAPAATEPGTYYWQERAIDAAGTLVHLGACGVAHETTLVVAPSSPPSTPDAAASVLAATGAVGASARTITGGAIALLTAGGTLVGLSRRRHSTSLAVDG
jgi:hypothetical protein